MRRKQPKGERKKAQRGLNKKIGQYETWKVHKGHRKIRMSQKEALKDQVKCKTTNNRLLKDTD